MASYDLNAMLRSKAAAAASEKTKDEIHLDDVTRVKVLSPARQVFKRFIRNRLAVFGTILLIVMFLFAFAGPLFYPYGQKQIFYKYDAQNVNYALAKEGTAYNGYVTDSAAEVSRTANLKVNTSIKQMLSEGNKEFYFEDSDALYGLKELGENIYTLTRYNAEEVCVFGENKVYLGLLDTIKKEINSADVPENFAVSAAKLCKGNSGEFDLDGVHYTYQKNTGKSYDIYADNSGFVYSGRELGSAFETAAEKAAESGESFKNFGKSYAVVSEGNSAAVYALDDAKPAMVYTRFSLDTYETGKKVSDEFRVNALLAAYGSGKFEADGTSYSVEKEDDALIIRDADGNEFADLTTFIIRRYNGEDTMAYDLKEAIRKSIENMSGMSTELTYALPQQNSAGEYDYDENGQLKYNDTKMKITQKDTGEYIINCDQIIFLIDRYASPTRSHILGTDADGFDVLARIMYGGRISLMVGFVVVFLESFLGIIMGGLAGYYGGWVDNLIMRLVDIFYCLPSTPIMIILGAMMDALRMNTYVRLIIMMAALGIMGWAGVARLVRGQILSLREQEFMVAAEATGVRVKHRIFRHLVPNVMPQLIVTATMGMGSVIITESTLSYLGLGVKHPLATWGTIINSVSSASDMAHYPYIWIPVGLLICLTVIAFNFVGDGLRDAYDPKAKR